MAGAPFARSNDSSKQAQNDSHIRPSGVSRTGKRLNGLVRGVQSVLGAQDYLRKSARDNVRLYGRDHERAAASQNELEMQTKANAVYNKYLRRFILPPDHPFRRRWDALQILCMLYISIVVPFRVGLGVYAQGGWYIFELAIDAYFYFDLVLNFFTGHQSADGTLIMEPQAVAFHYMRSWFLPDVVSCLPVDVIVRVAQGTFYCSLYKTCDHKVSTAGMLFRLLKILRLFKLIKLVRLFSIQRLLNRYQHDLFLILPFISVAQMFVVILFLGHLFGCGFYFFSTNDWRTGTEKRDLEAALSAIQNSSSLDRHKIPWIITEFGGEYGTPGSTGLATRYIGSLYWAFATLCTVGYGDVSARTDWERLAAIFAMITGGFVFSSVIAKIGSLVAKLDAAKTAHNDKMDAVTAFIREHKMPRDLRSQVLIFYTKQQIRSYNVRTILSQLPYDLRSSVLLYLYKDIIKKVPFFDGTDEMFITDVCLRLKPASFAAASYIYTAGEVGRELLVLVKGEVEVLGPLKQVTRVLYEGSYFGEGSILGDIRRMESVRARTPCSLCALEADDLEELLLTYPEMDKMLRRVYVQRKQHFQSSSQSFSSETSTDRRNNGRRSTEPGGLLARASTMAGPRRILSVGPQRPPEEPPASPENVVRGEANLGPPDELSPSNGGTSRMSDGGNRDVIEGATRAVSEALGFGSPPEGQESPGSQAEGRFERKLTARLKKNQVVPEKCLPGTQVQPATGDAPGQTSDRNGNGNGNGNEIRHGSGGASATGTSGATEHGTVRTGGAPAELDATRSGNESPTGRKAYERGPSAGGGLSKLLAEGSNRSSPDLPEARLGDGQGRWLPYKFRTPTESPVPGFPPRSSTPGASILEGAENGPESGGENGTGSGMGFLRTELRTLKQEVKMMRAEHRQDAAMLQDQVKAMMSLLLKVSRQAEANNGASSDFFVRS